MNTEKNISEIIIYQNEAGDTKVDVRFFNENVWITAKSMAEIFKSDYSNVLKHIKNIYNDGELQEDMTMAKFASVVQRGFRGEVYEDIIYYNLDMIISVGYRVKSTTAIHFRQWATKILKEYLKKGFVMDDERLKQKNNNYFDELLERIRDIRSSEKVFYSKVLDIYATSIDYDPKTAESKAFFATVQNKMHWAVHNKTASELIFERANADKDFMGIVNIENIKEKIKKADVVCAKNYLSENELQILNRLVNMYLEYAELQAFEKVPMTMKDWIDKLDIFLKMTNKEVLNHNGTVSHLQAEEKAVEELEKYRKRIKDNELSKVEKHFLQSLNEIEKKAKKIKAEK